VQLVLSVGLGPLSTATALSQILYVSAGSSVHAGAEIDEASRLLDQRCQDLGRNDVNCEHKGKPVFGFDTPWLAIADTARQCCALADDGLVLRQRPADIVGTREIASVDNHMMPLLHEQLTGHQPQTIRRSCNKDA
jgi:hypothetical protein